MIAGSVGGSHDATGEMTRPRWPGWMQAPTIAEYDAEDQARREDERLDEKARILELWAGELRWQAAAIRIRNMVREHAWWELEYPGWDWTPGSLKRVDEYIEGDVIWP